MGGHEISIKSIFDFRTSLPINEILYIQYIIRQYRYGVFLYEIYLDEAKKQGHCEAEPQCPCFLASSK
jgi:hypothetical protein